jgi:hypothetical protein
VAGGIGALAFGDEFVAVLPAQCGQLVAVVGTGLTQFLTSLSDAGGGVGGGLTRRGCLGQRLVTGSGGGLDALVRVSLRGPNLLCGPLLGAADLFVGVGAHRSELTIRVKTVPVELAGELGA